MTARAGAKSIVMLLSDSFGGHGGISTYNRELVCALAPAPGTDAVTIIQRLSPETEAPLPSRVTLDMAAVNGMTGFVRSVASHALSARRVDHVHCGHINLAPFASAIAAVKRVPWSLTIHGIEAWQRHPRPSVRWALRNADSFYPVSEYTASKFSAWTGIGHERMTVLPNTVHLEAFGIGPKTPELVERYKTSGKRVLMTFGRLVDKQRAKGFDEVLDVLPRLLARHPDLVYLIVGGGPDRSRLEQKAAALGVSDSVVFTGRISDAEKADTLRLADLFLMPSRGEGFGIVLLETMACGVPVVASSADGSREAVLDGKLGTVVDPDQPEQLIAAVEQGLSLPVEVPPGLHHFSFEAFTARAQSTFGVA